MPVHLVPMVLFVTALLVQQPAERQQDSGTHTITTPSESAAVAYRDALQRMTSRELESRKKERLTLQRRGYAAILHDVLRRDGLGALMAMAKTKAHLDIHLPQNTLILTVPVEAPRRVSKFQIFSAPPSPPLQIPLHEDRTFPADPWHK